MKGDGRQETSSSPEDVVMAIATDAVQLPASVHLELCDGPLPVRAMCANAPSRHVGVLEGRSIPLGSQGHMKVPRAVTEHQHLQARTREAA